MLSKGVESRNYDSGLGKILRTFNAPSGNQIMADGGPFGNAGIGAMTGLFPIMNHSMNDEAKAARPEWEAWLGI